MGLIISILFRNQAQVINKKSYLPNLKQVDILKKENLIEYRKNRRKFTIINLKKYKFLVFEKTLKLL